MKTERILYLSLLRKEVQALERIARALEFLVEDARSAEKHEEKKQEIYT